MVVTIIRTTTTRTKGASQPFLRACRHISRLYVRPSTACPQKCFNFWPRECTLREPTLCVLKHEDGYCRMNDGNRYLWVCQLVESGFGTAYLLTRLIQIAAMFGDLGSISTWPCFIRTKREIGIWWRWPHAYRFVTVRPPVHVRMEQASQIQISLQLVSC
jgi:hypothetical protein